MEYNVVLIIAGSLTMAAVVIWIRYYRWKKNFQTASSIMEAATIQPFRQSVPLINKEISRVRRYQRALAVIVLRRKVLPEAAPQNGTLHAKAPTNGQVSPQQNPLPHMEFLLCGAIFRDALRETDIITYDGGKNQFILIMPETTRLEALQTVERLDKILSGKLYKDMEFGIAEFPEEGFIINDLVENAMTNIGDKKSLSLKEPANVRKK
ncbi:MAG: hypothetical protein KDH97_00905 [Calditrichaeota bacterium]|nr:hypothetical protein [Calditrichota bacterium]MCB9090789.1 hypothetical protein [Calditrichia bacterium]MCB0288790.1 hypothetical protein [Calditrichota bacterium]MCB0293865.1 hypothetical protein [Calditrichota bacterium]MCB0302548.1 hypothetical protein [Calditrichota bacterium]